MYQDEEHKQEQHKAGVNAPDKDIDDKDVEAPVEALLNAFHLRQLDDQRQDHMQRARIQRQQTHATSAQ